MVEAKDLATFIIEPVGADIMNPDTYLVRKRFQDTETTTSYANTAFSTALQDISIAFCESASSVGCRIWLKNGLYEIDQGPDTDGGLVEWSNPTEGSHVSVYMEGETRDGCIIRNIETTPEETPTSRIFLVRCNFSINNLTMDGGGVITNSLNGIDAFGQSSGDMTLEAHYCRFMNQDGKNIGTANPWGVTGRFVVDNCILEKPVAQHDQLNMGGITGHASIRNNYFDRTNGGYTGFGSTITAGGGNNIVIDGNVIKRNQGELNFGISLEASFGNFSNCVISNNWMDNGMIWVGDSGTWSNTCRRIWVTNNRIYKGGIKVQGPSAGGGKCEDVVVENNQLIDSWTAGLWMKNTTGYVTFRNNSIRNSNFAGGGYTGQEPLIYAETSTDAIIENNHLYMGVVSPPDAFVSPEGIRYTSLVNPTIRNNRILNRTVSNPSYTSGGTHTGSVLISRNL